MRELATIQRILAIDPIPGADAIEVATIKGWKVVIKKGEYSVGDLCVYCEVDSWIPHAIAPFLSKGSSPREYEGIVGERLKTIRLRGQISQGLILPLSVAYIKVGNPLRTLNEGDDVSSFLNIVKWDPPVPANLAGIMKGNWPTELPKTDEERIQNLTAEWDELRVHTYERTEKLEGSSCQFGYINGEFLVCSRNVNLARSENNSFWGQAIKYDLEEKMKVMPGIVIRCEIVGEGIEGNIYGLKGQDIYVYGVYDTNSGQFLNPVQRYSVAQTLGVKHVPIISDRFLPGSWTVEEMIKSADGKSAVNPNVLREGVVYNRIDGPEHFKTVSNEYLLAHKK